MLFTPMHYIPALRCCVLPQVSGRNIREERSSGKYDSSTDNESHVRSRAPVVVLRLRRFVRAIPHPCIFAEKITPRVVTIFAIVSTYVNNARSDIIAIVLLSRFISRGRCEAPVILLLLVAILRKLCEGAHEWKIGATVIAM